MKKLIISGSHAYQQISSFLMSDIKCLCAGDDSGSDGAGENHSAEMSAVLRESARPAGESSPHTPSGIEPLVSNAMFLFSNSTRGAY